MFDIEAATAQWSFSAPILASIATHAVEASSPIPKAAPWAIRFIAQSGNATGHLLPRKPLLFNGRRYGGKRTLWSAELSIRHRTSGLIVSSVEEKAKRAEAAKTPEIFGGPGRTLGFLWAVSLSFGDSACVDHAGFRVKTGSERQSIETTRLTPSGHFEGTREADQAFDCNHSEKARMVLARGWLGLLTTWKL